MKKNHLIALSFAALISLNAAPAAATSPVPIPVIKAPEFPSPGEIVAAAPASDWAAIAPSDLLVMELAKNAKGQERRVVIQLMPAPFSQGWVGNIRKLAAARFWEGTSINRVQDNYVVQWGDATEKKALPSGLLSVPETEYIQPQAEEKKDDKVLYEMFMEKNPEIFSSAFLSVNDPYAAVTRFDYGWPIGLAKNHKGVTKWPVHCYGMVGVGRNLSPDTGTGAELYTVIGHAPRHLDRNIALVGRVIEGMEHLSALPRGTGDLGFYKTAQERTAITSVRMMSEMPQDKSLPVYEFLSTESESFAKYASARANRRDPFFIKPAGGADICNIPVPVRRKL